MESLRMSDSRGSYGSVTDRQEVTNKRSRARAMLVCGIVCILVVAGAALVIGTVRGTGGTLIGQPASSTPPSVKNVPGATTFATVQCEEQEKLVPPDSCVICLSVSATPQTTPSRCPAGTYWDEEETCSCIPCEKNSCCLAGDVMNQCPVGSFQPNRGGKTCQLIGVGGATNGFEWTPIFGSVLRTKPATPQKLVRSVQSPISCGGVRKSAAVISGINLNGGDAKVSIKVGVEKERGANTDVSISKVSQSRINGAAFSVVGTCVGADSIMTMGRLKASNIQKGTLEKRTLVTNLKCTDSTPRVFAGIDEIEAVGLDKAFSLSISASARSNRNGFVRPRVEFSSTTGVVAAGAGVVAYCNSQDALFGQGYIETGNIDGSSFSLQAKKDGTDMYVSKTVTFENEMKCGAPQVALSLTQLQVSRGMAVNLQFMSSTSKSFTMRFVAMGGTQVTSIKAAYLATCPHDTGAVTQAVKQTCGSVPTLETPRPTAKPSAKPTPRPTPKPTSTAQPTGKPTRTKVTIPPSITRVQVEAQWTVRSGSGVDLDVGASVYTSQKNNSGYCYYAAQAYPATGTPAISMPFDNRQGGSEKMQIYLNQVPSSDQYIVVSLVIFSGATSFQDVASCKVILTDMGANKEIATFNMLQPGRRGGNAILLAYFKRDQGTARWSYMPLGRMLTTNGENTVVKIEKYVKPIVATL